MTGEVDPTLAEQLARLTEGVTPLDYSAASGTDIAALLRARTPKVDFPPPQNIAIEDHTVPVTGGCITVRRYCPLTDMHGGAVLNIHGGGWVLGDLGSDEMRCRSLASESGCQVFSVDYRLAPEHRFPVPGEDCYAALTWVHRQAAAFGIDPARIGIAGSSAGGNLAAAVTMMARDRHGPAITYQLLVYPVCDRDENPRSWRNHGGRFPLTQADMIWFWDQYAPGDTALHPYASVLRAADLAGLPPAHVALAECDLLHDEGVAYAERLGDSGVPVTTGVYPGMVHGFLAVAPDHPQSRKALADFGALLRAALAPCGRYR